MEDNKKRTVSLNRLAYAGTAVLLAAAAAAVFLPSVKSVAFTIAAADAIGMFVLLRKIFSDTQKRDRGVDTVLENSDGCALIKYDKKSETAYLPANFSELTGIETASAVLDDVDYKKLMCELISYPSDAGSDIYMAFRHECWLKINAFENEDYEFTIVRDVSEYVSCKNIIKTLKYYDNETGVLCRDAFIAKVRSVSENGGGDIGMISLLISGVDKVSSFKGSSAADKVIRKAAAFVKRFENPHNTFAGRTATNEFCLLLTDAYEDGCKKYACKLFNGLTEVLGSLDSSEYTRVYCGYALFSGDEHDAGTMMASVDYAAFEAKTSAASEPVAFDRANYVLRAFDFKKIQVFNTIIAENRINYYFQPVVDAHTGEIFGYEALMRPQEIDGIRLTPLETLKIAEEQGMLPSIEYLTLSNTIGFLSENQEFFCDKRLFVNTIPNCFIPDQDYENIFEKYNGVFDKLIIEITEGMQITSESIGLIRSRYGSRRSLIALDDYGSGYANESTLLSIQPDFIKIDHSLIRDIDSDIQKQHLVKNMINFAKIHGIKTLSEGVETKGELETVITLGIDLIQGFYTSKPNAVILLDIPANIKDEILDINLKNIGYAKKSYRLASSEPVDIAALAVQGYTDVIIEAEEVSLFGSAVRSVNMRISCMDNYCGKINVRNVNIFGLEAPVLTLGRNCSVTLNVDGKNYFCYEGIRVPESSRFALIGEGQLNIDMNSSSGVIIGGDHLQDFGALTVNLDGSLNITSKSENIVAVGGGVGGGNSSIEIVGGLITAELKGISVTGIGAVSGSVPIKLNKCSIDIDSAGQNVVAIGSKCGKADIECSSSIAAVCSGDNCCALGTLEKGSGSITINRGKYELTVNAKNSVGIGSVDGKIRISANSGEYKISCEGNNAVGIGDGFGSGDVTVSGGIYKLHIAASTETSIGSKNGKTIIKGGNINTDSKEKINAVSPYGDMLEIRHIDSCEKFRRTVVFGGSEYAYAADTAEGDDFVNVYLPVGYELN
ncbi:MAG: EAL domain-containing protein [Oscillospiraceae bacterium]